MPGRTVRLGVVLAILATLMQASAAVGASAELRGRLLSGRVPLASVPVTLYRTVPGRRPVALGTAVSRADGRFRISYRTGSGVVYLIAGRREDVRLASVLGAGSVPRSVVVNERTTVAAGFALAQFVHGREIAGKAPGLQNAAGMAQNLADVRTGGTARVLARAPNGSQTSTLRAFNSVANMLVRCARFGRCGRLFRLAKPPRGRAPRGTLAAVASVARNPWQNVRKLYALSGAGPYRPVLRRAPDAWTLALRFVGNGTSVDGPGNMAIDAKGNVWVTNNYTFGRDPTKPVCGGKQLLEFTPTGRAAPGSPWSGGGLDGAGFGITIDTRAHVWVGNFGFASPQCAQQPSHDTVSEFTTSGKPLSGDGYTQGPISFPQGTVSDREGGIWIANCGNGTVVKYPAGNPDAAQVFETGVAEPFDIAFNLEGQAFVTGNESSSVAVLNPDGTPSHGLPPIQSGGLDKPLGIAADTLGDMWVANSGLVTVPCATSDVETQSSGGSLTFINANGVPAVTSYTGGGLTVPWGLAVDGADHVWVANFAGQRLSEFCGVRPATCPPGKDARGMPISPPSGYGFDGLVRNTGVQIDPSGNVWVCNNWKTIPIQTNPGGYQVVAFVGLAHPIRTPLIGPPRPL
jgi:hypothetical protein